MKSNLEIEISNYLKNQSHFSFYKIKYLIPLKNQIKNIL